MSSSPPTSRRQFHPSWVVVETECYFLWHSAGSTPAGRPWGLSQVRRRGGLGAGRRSVGFPATHHSSTATVEPERSFTQAFQVQFLAVGQPADRHVRTKGPAPTPDAAPVVYRSRPIVHGDRPAGALLRLWSKRSGFESRERIGRSGVTGNTLSAAPAIFRSPSPSP